MRIKYLMRVSFSHIDQTNCGALIVELDMVMQQELEQTDLGAIEADLQDAMLQNELDLEMEYEMQDNNEC